MNRRLHHVFPVFTPEMESRMHAKGKTTVDMSGLYVHIPFCTTRCIYCSFCSTTHAEWHAAYIRALRREMELRRGELAACGQISTIYIGGGTPSVLSHGLLRQLFADIRTTMLQGKSLHQMKETTIECNPDDVTEQLARMLHDEGVGRVSLGVQTFSDQRLRFLRRRHSSRGVFRAVDLLRRAGIGNISIDLIYGFPAETADDWQDDIRQALSLRVPHISAYSLAYEENTPLWKMRETGAVKELDEEQSRSMYYQLIDRLTQAGYQHYEISNFALPSHRAQHNSSYWNDTHYIGLGASAHSYLPQIRLWNTDDVASYIREVNNGHLPFEAEHIDADTHFNDLIATALRTSSGLSLNYLKQIFPPSYVDRLLSDAQKHIDNGSLRLEDNNLRLTTEALYISNDIMSDLVRT